MLKQVADDIYQLIIQYAGGMGETNSYFIKGDKGFTVIDTGYYSEQAIYVWKEVLEEGHPIEKIVLTHVHQDHIGGWLDGFKKTLVFLLLFRKKG